MGFYPMNDLHQCLENGEAFVWIFKFLLKTVGVVCSLTNCNGLKLKCERVTLKAWVTSLITWDH